MFLYFFDEVCVADSPGQETDYWDGIDCMGVEGSGQYKRATY